MATSSFKNYKELDLKEYRTFEIIVSNVSSNTTFSVSHDLPDISKAFCSGILITSDNLTERTLIPYTIGLLVTGELLQYVLISLDNTNLNVTYITNGSIVDQVVRATIYYFT